MDNKDYGWADYYRYAYEREKKSASVLAGNLYEAERKRDEARAKYQKITGNVVWKCLAPFRLMKRVGRKIKTITRPRVERACADPAREREIYEQYITESMRQMDPYREWVRRKEPKFWGIALNKCTVSDEEVEKVCVIRSYEELSGIREADKLLPDERTELLLLARDPKSLLEAAPKFALSSMREHKEALFWYADEDHADAKGRRYAPWFKQAWSPDSLIGFFCFGSFVALRADAVRGIELSGDPDPLINLYELCLALAYGNGGTNMQAAAACRTPLVLYSVGSVSDNEGKNASPVKRQMQQTDEPVVLETTVSEDYRNYPEYWGYEKKYISVKQKAFEKIGLSSMAYPTALRGVWSVAPVCEAYGVVSVVIPSKDNFDVLAACIRSFTEKTDYPAVEFVVVDNGSSEENKKQVEDFLKEIDRLPMVTRTQYLYQKEVFNFSAMCNRGVAASGGEYVLLLNDDIEIIEKNWLKIMVGQALIPGTGAVGAKLWYPDCERIQHAGITNLTIGPSHKLITFPEDRLYYYGHGALVMDMIGVTAACLLVRKEIYDSVGGMNEEMAVAYNDVEFCFKLYRNGYRNVQRNDAVLWHHESVSRGKDDLSDEKWERLLSEKERLYALYPERRGDDPYYSCYLKQNSSEYTAGYEFRHEDRLYTARPEEGKGVSRLLRAKNAAMMLTVERALTQRKYHKSEPDILMVEGWCYLRGGDNAMYEVFLVLTEGDRYYECPANARYRYDVCAILPHENNIRLAGFSCRIDKIFLQSGRYRVGLLYRHKISGQEFYAESDFTVEV